MMRMRKESNTIEGVGGAKDKGEEISLEEKRGK